MTKITKHHIFRRAHELTRLNIANPGIKYSSQFGKWLRYAWNEAKTGATSNWTWLNDANRLAWLENRAAEIRVMSHTRGNDQADCHRQLDRIYSEIAAIAA